MDKKQLWLDFAHDATNRYVIPEDIDDTEELVDDMIDVATGYADAMVSEFEERFEGGKSRRRKTKRSKIDDEEEDER